MRNKPPVRLFHLSFGESGESYRKFMQRSGVSSAESRFRFPARDCPACSGGQVWNERLSGEKVDELVAEGPLPTILPVDEWSVLARRWARELRIDLRRIVPECELGPPLGSALRTDLDPVVSPSVGWFWFSKRLVDKITAAGLTGCGFHKVKWVSKVRPSRPYFELDALGSVKHDRVPGSIVRCRVCGSVTSVRVSERPTVWTKSWSGEDFCRSEGLAVFVVSERALSLLREESENVVGYECEPV